MGSLLDFSTIFQTLAYGFLSKILDLSCISVIHKNCTKSAADFFYQDFKFHRQVFRILKNPFHTNIKYLTHKR
jgi:hypothetical protein